MVTMHLKPKQPEKYDGKHDFQTIDNWVASMDSYFAITEARPPLIFHYLNTIFTGEAATWFRYHFWRMDPMTVTWEAVRMELLTYFVKPNHTRRLRDQWAETQQIGSVMEYHICLSQTAMQLGNVSQEEFLDKFICGLKPNTWTELEFRNPQNITEAVKWADAFDAWYYCKKDSSSYYYSSRHPQHEDNRGKPMQIDMLQTTLDPTDISIPIQIDVLRMNLRSSKLKKLTDEEWTHLRSIGACFKYQKQGHMAWECPVNSSKPSKNEKCQ